ncbi:hypothetical protein R3P38DRAFT_2491623 [Favolaschia claudopus]|uniref:RNase H type-1 domain-containing protein n=1 Tax=Favolaschia claudopus TaxID=2862362 RepID=A0AAW0EDT2_9AGAR
MLAVESLTIQENIAKLEEIMRDAFHWSFTHACSFDLGKFQLVHYTRNRGKYAPTPLITPTHVIPATDSATYLGLIMDRQLRWKEQVQRAVAKGTKAILAVSRLTRPSFGLPHRYVRQLYRSVVIPRMEYGLCVWYSPVVPNGNGRRKGSVGVLKQIQKVQNVACRLITGAFKTTPIDALNYMANIPPIELRLNQASFNSAARLAALPPAHPLHKMVHRCMRMFPQHHRSVLHDMFAAFPEIANLETIDPTPLDTTWKAPFSYRIAANKEDTEKELTMYAGRKCFFGDGSGYEGGIGAAAVVQREDGVYEKRQVHLGNTDEHTVFEAEIVGLILCLSIAASIPRLRSVAFLIDNQAAIRAVANPKPQPGQHLVRLFHDTLRDLMRKRRTFDLQIGWVPGHQGVEGNEVVDEAAKEAAQGQFSELPTKLHILHDLPSSVAALKAGRKHAIARSWASIWQESRAGQRIAAFDKTPPGRRTLRWYEDLHRGSCSIITQLRTGHIGLNAYLARFGAVDSPKCHTCGEPETVRHYLLTCRRFSKERDDLRHALHSSGRQKLDIKTLLGRPKNKHHLLKFVSATERFPRYDTSPPQD